MLSCCVGCGVPSPAAAGESDCEAARATYVTTVSYDVVNEHNKGCSVDADCALVTPPSCLSLCPVSVLGDRVAAYESEVRAVACSELTCVPPQADCMPRRARCERGTCVTR